MTRTSVIDNLTKKLIFALLFSIGLFLIFSFLPKDAHAVNQAGWGYSIPVGRTNDPSCFPSTSNRTWVKVLVIDAVTKNPVDATIRIEDPGGAISAQDSGTDFLEMPCAVTSNGIWLSVWNASGYRAWDLSTNFNGRSNNYNFCCGFKFLDQSADDGKTVTFQVLLVPNSIAIPTITATSPIGTSTTDPARTIITTTGVNANVDFNVTTGPRCNCGSGSSIINRVFYLENLNTGAVTLEDADGFGGSFGFGANLTLTRNLAVGRYRWYMQTQENRRNYVFIPNTLPITAQFPWQYFEVVRLQPNLNATVSNPGTVTVGSTINFTGTVTNNGNTNTGVGFNTRFCIDYASCYTSAGGSLGPSNPFVGVLNNGQNDTRTSNNWTATVGSHTIRFCVDVNGPSGVVAESNEAAADNCGSQTFTVVVPQPDLTSTVNAFTPITTGQAVTFSATVNNVGTAAAGSFNSRFCIDVSQATCYTTTTGRVGGSDPNISSLAVGANTTASAPATWTATAGAHIIRFCADVNGPSGSVVESNENNNCSSRDFNVVAPAPNYVVDSVAANEPLITGNPISFNAVVRNNGTANAPIGGFGRFCIDITAANCYAIANPAGRVGTNPSLPAINVASTATVNSTGGTWNAVAGGHTVTFCADIQLTGFLNGRVAELTEGSVDNCRTATINVAAARPNYVVTSVTIIEPSPYVVGSNLSFRAAVVNAGEKDAQSDEAQGRFCVFPVGVSDSDTWRNCYTDPPIGAGGTIVRNGPDLLFIPRGGSIIPRSTDGFVPPSLVGTWTAAVGSHRATYCADVRIEAGASVWGEVRETNETALMTLDEAAEYNCYTWDFTVSADASWLQTRFGDVGSHPGNIGDLDTSHGNPGPPATGERSADYLVISGSAINSGLNTAKSWLVPSYSLTLPEVNNYASIKSKFGANVAATAFTGDLPGITPVGGVVVHRGNLTWTGGYTGGACAPGAQQGKVVFIEDDPIIPGLQASLTLGNGSQTDFTPNCPTVIIAQGDINIHSAIVTINAFLISNGRFGAGVSSQQLIINGGVISSLNSLMRPHFDDRAYTTGGEPAVRIDYRPEYLWILRDLLGISKSQYSETNP